MERDEDTLDGRTFEPRWGQVATRRDPRPVFSEQNRERLAADRHLRPYLTMTQLEVAGLLYALGRCGGVECPPGSDSEAALEASGELERFYCELASYKQRSDPLPPPAPGAVFDAAEQHELSYRTNIQGFERITRDGLIRLLRAVDRYALHARYVDVFSAEGSVLIARWLHAHNILIAFRERPMTLEEFSEQVGYLISEVERREKAQRPTEGDRPSARE